MKLHLATAASSRTNLAIMEMGAALPAPAAEQLQCTACSAESISRPSLVNGIFCFR